MLRRRNLVSKRFVCLLVENCNVTFGVSFTSLPCPYLLNMIDEQIHEAFKYVYNTPIDREEKRKKKEGREREGESQNR